MPLGRYTVLGDDGAPVGTEEFRCAPGPMGWRYFSEVQTDHHEIVDVAVDRDWRIARVRIDTGEHDILLEPRGDALAGYRDRREIEIAYGPEMHLDYFTPATNAITVAASTGTAEIDVVYLEPVTLEPTRSASATSLHGPRTSRPRLGRSPATRWTFTDAGLGLDSRPVGRGRHRRRLRALFTLEEYEPGGSHGVLPIA